jgi:transposase
VPVGGAPVRVYLFVATLGYSRLHVQAFRHERQAAWLDGIEASFAAFGGIPQEVLFV